MSKFLPRGLVFPFDFGFIPSTPSEDGDPPDVLVWMCEAVPEGCRLPALLPGVIEAEQVKDGKSERNDRLVAVCHYCREHKDVNSLSDLDGSVVNEIEHFFIAHNEVEGKQFKPVARHGPHHTAKLVRKGGKRYRVAGRD